jgi:hypothetical protein
MKFLSLILALLLLAACAGTPDLDDPKLSERKLNLEDFFEGQSRAYGQFQDRFGNVSRRFTVDIDGKWDGRTLVLTEDFTYDDGSTEQRVWTLQKTGEDSWRGTAPGVLGEATGQESGDTFNWQYRIDLPVPDGTLRVRFDDWMWLLPDGRLLNRAYMYKFGVQIGEVILFFEKG